MLCKPDHGASYSRPWHETGRGNLQNDLRSGIILYCQAERTIILGARANLHPVRHFLLNHNSNAGKGHLIFKQTHNNRRCDVIGKICHDLNGPAVIFFFCKLPQIYLQDILIDHRHIIVFA